MDFYMPSEVSRLVLGYLRETGCVQTSSVYLDESPHLAEYAACLKQGVEYPTKICGQSLTDVIRELCATRASKGSSATERSVDERHGQSFDEIKVILERLDRSLAQLISLAATGRLRNVGDRDSELEYQSQGVGGVGVPRSYVSVATSPLPPESPMTLADELEIVSNDIPTIRIEEASSSETHEAVNVHSIDKSRNRTPAHGRTSATSTVDMMASSSDIFYCSRLAHSHATPNRRPLDIYSSPTSIARSALLFSLGIEALQTPIKEIVDVDNGKSPRRKNQLPRKRLTYTPSSSAKKRHQQACGSAAPSTTMPTATDADGGHNEDSVDVSELFGQLLSSTALHECIAANINRVVCNTTEEATQGASSENHVDQVLSSNPVVTSPATTTSEERTVEVADIENAQPNAASDVSTEHLVPDNVVKDIVDRTESDPLFEAFINIFFDKQDVNQQESDHTSDTTGPGSHGSSLTETTISPPASHSDTPDTPSDDVIVAVDNTLVSVPESSIEQVDHDANGPCASMEPAVTGTDLPSQPRPPISTLPTLLSSQTHPLDAQALSPQIVVNDLQLESSVITTDTVANCGNVGVGMTKTMTFTVLEPTNSLKLQDYQEPGTLAYMTLSPSQLLSLNCNDQECDNSKMTSTIPQSRKHMRVTYDLDAVEKMIISQSQPRRKLLSLNKSSQPVSKTCKNNRQKQITSVNVMTGVTHLGRQPEKVCAVPLNFSNGSVTSVSLLKPNIRRNPSSSKAREPSKSTKNPKTMKSPNLRSLLAQSAILASHRKIAAATVDKPHVRVLSFGAQSATSASATAAPGVPESTSLLPSSNTSSTSDGGKMTSCLIGASAPTIGCDSLQKSGPHCAFKRKAQTIKSGPKPSDEHDDRKRSKVGTVLPKMDVKNIPSSGQ